MNCRVIRHEHDRSKGLLGFLRPRDLIAGYSAAELAPETDPKPSRSTYARGRKPRRKVSPVEARVAAVLEKARGRDLSMRVIRILARCEQVGLTSALNALFERRQIEITNDGAKWRAEA